MARPPVRPLRSIRCRRPPNCKFTPWWTAPSLCILSPTPVSVSRSTVPCSRTPARISASSSSRLRRSRTTESIPSRCKRCESSRPAGPPPTIPICVCIDPRFLVESRSTGLPLQGRLGWHRLVHLFSRIPDEQQEHEGGQDDTGIEHHRCVPVPGGVAQDAADRRREDGAHLPDQVPQPERRAEEGGARHQVRREGVRDGLQGVEEEARAEEQHAEVLSTPSRLRVSATAS